MNIGNLIKLIIEMQIPSLVIYFSGLAFLYLGLEEYLFISFQQQIKPIFSFCLVFFSTLSDQMRLCFDTEYVICLHDFNDKVTHFGCLDFTGDVSIF